LAEKYGEDMVEGGGLKITTTLDLKIQAKAQQIVAEEVEKAEKMGISNGLLWLWTQLPVKCWPWSVVEVMIVIN
jgi:membrane carboxypeptidase/penicillin-binding protein